MHIPPLGPGRTINARAESALAALLESLSCVKPSGAAAPAAEGQHLQHSGSSAEA